MWLFRKDEGDFDGDNEDNLVKGWVEVKGLLYRASEAAPDAKAYPMPRFATFSLVIVFNDPE